MPARSDFVLVALLFVILGTFIKESRENLSSRAECLRVCGLSQKERSKKGVQESRFYSCYQCLKRRQERYSITLKQRQRRSIFQTSKCVGATEDKLVPDKIMPSKVNVTFGQYENTRHWYVNASWSPLNDSSGYLYGTLLRLSVKEHDPNLYCTELPKNQTFVSNINISFYDYTCPDYIWLQVLGLPYRDRIMQMDSYQPKACLPTPSTAIKTTDQPRSSTGFTVITTTGPNHTLVYVSICIGVLVGLALVAGLLKYFVFPGRDVSSSPEFDYDAFIIYNAEDENWVVRKLLPLLEEKHHLKCCIHYRDFKPGVPYEDNMAHGVYKSHKIIAVFSNNFLMSNYCIYELDLAKYRLLNKRDDSLIIIRIDKADYNRLPRKLRKRNFIDYSSPLERPFWEERLLKFLDVSNDQSATVQQNNDTSIVDDCDISNNNIDRCDFSRLNSNTSSGTMSTV